MVEGREARREGDWEVGKLGNLGEVGVTLFFFFYFLIESISGSV